MSLLLTPEQALVLQALEDERARANHPGFVKAAQVKGKARGQRIRVGRAEDDAAAFAAFPGPSVAKYDGLAEGKGVVVCDDPAQLAAALADLRARFGPRAHVLVEERLTGPELSVFLLVADGASRATLVLPWPLPGLPPLT